MTLRAQEPLPAASSPSALSQPEWRIELREAVRLALQQSDIVRTIDAGQVRVAPITGFDPAIAAERSESADAAFDPQIASSIFASWIDKPPSAFYGPGIETQTEWHQVDFVARLTKPWSTGGSTSIGYAPPLAYLYFPTGGPNAYNPTYSSDIVLELRQPLLRGAGRPVNTAPLRIARSRYDQSLYAVAEATLAEVRSVIESYWHLQASATAVQAVESIIPMAAESVRLEEHRLEVERSIYADVARARVQFEALRQELSRAQLSMQEQRLQLGNLIGLSAMDSIALIPVDAPHRSPPTIDLQQAVATAAMRRPDLMQQRLQLKILSDNLLVSRNQLEPQLDLTAQYRTSGISDRMEDSAIQMSRLGYNDWTVGLTFSVPLGSRRARADVQSSELHLARERSLLSESERQVAYELAVLINRIQAAWDQWESASRQAQETQEWLRLARLRYTLPTEGDFGDDGSLLSLVDYQMAMFAAVDATSTAALLLARYHALLARLSEAEGTLLDQCDIRWQDSAAAPNSGPTALPVEARPPPASPPPASVQRFGGHSTF